MAGDSTLTPAGAGYISLASTAVSGLVSAFGSIGATRYSNAIAQSQANIARLNAQMMEQQTQAVFRSAEKDIVRKTMAAGQVKGKQRATLAANGIAVGTGSAAEIQASTDLIKEMDTITMRQNATRQAWGYRMKAVGYEGEAYMAQANKQSVWGNFGASVLGAASQVANQYLGYTALGVFGDGTQKAAPIEYKNVKLNGVLGGGK